MDYLKNLPVYELDTKEVIYNGSYLKNKEILKEQYIKVLSKMKHLPAPIQKTIAELIQNKQVSYADFEKYVDNLVD